MKLIGTGATRLYFATEKTASVSSSSERAQKRKTHRMLAWGVLGSASDGLPFLLTHPVVFRSLWNHL